MIKCFHQLLKNLQMLMNVVSSIMDSSKEQFWGNYQPIATALNELLIMYARKIINIKANIFYPKAVNTKFRDIIMPGEDKSKISSPADVANKIVKYILSSNETGKIIEIN